MSVYTDSTGLWNYTLNGGNATIGDGSWNGGSATTLGTSLRGAITIPSTVVRSLAVRSGLRRCSLRAACQAPCKA